MKIIKLNCQPYDKPTIPVRKSLLTSGIWKRLRVLMVLCALPLFASESVDRDDSRNALAQAEGVRFGSVDPRTGSLSFTVPMGIAYPQRGGSKFGLSLQYTSHVNFYRNNPETREGHGNGGPSSPPPIEQRLAFFRWKPGLAYAGLGMHVNTGFGALRIHRTGSAFGNEKKATLTMSDGREIYFYDVQKEGQTHAANNWFSRGGEYARLTYDPTGDIFQVEMPNGPIHVFEHDGETYVATKIIDRFNANNTITLDYGTFTQNNEEYPQWTITDSENRTFLLKFGKKFSPYGPAEAEDNPDIHPIFLRAPEFYVVTEIEVPAPKNTRQTYIIDHQVFTDFQPYNNPTSLDPLYFSEYTAYLASAITLPTQEKFSFTYNTLATDLHPGAIKSMTNPNGGTASWNYTELRDPNNAGPSHHDPFMGVSDQSIFDRDGLLLSKTEYLFKIMTKNGIANLGSLNTEGRYDRATVVRHYETNTAYNDTIYYYNLRNYPITQNREEHREQGSGVFDIPHYRIQSESRFYQLPGTLHETFRFYQWEYNAESYTGEDAFLSMRSFDGDYTQDQIIQSQYVRYESDPWLTQQDGETVRVGHDQLVNARAYLNINYYHENDTFSVHLQRDENGFGQFRQKFQSTAFDANATSLIDLAPRITNIEYQTDATPNMHPANRNWVLNLPVSQTTGTSPSDKLYRQDSDYDPTTGFLRRFRQCKSTDGTLGPNDKLTTFVANGNGRVIETMIYGGDLQNLPFNENTALKDVDLSALTPESWTKNTYRYGSEQDTIIMDPQNDSEFQKTSLSIDANTGLTLSQKDPAGITIQFDYDVLGRLSLETPPTGARTITTYIPATDTTPTKVSITQNHQGSTLTKTVKILDGWGRVERQTVQFPNNVTTLQQWDYRQRPDGYLNKVSTVYDRDFGQPTWVEFEYDALGRQISKKLPDGALTTQTITGNSTVTEERSFDTGDCNGQRLKTFEYDAIGRLIAVTQADEDNGNNATTSYQYNLQNKLTHVMQDTTRTPVASQTRTWEYDGLGNLIVETHPEIDGTTYYNQYDSVGNILEQEILGAHETQRTLHYYNDPKNRITQIWDDIANRPIESFYYARSNDGNNLRAGKLYQVQRHNYVPVGQNLHPGSPASMKEIVVTRTYFYSEPNGRVTELRTRTSPTNNAPAMSFEQSFTYSPIGQIEDLAYPMLPAELAEDTDRVLHHHYHAGNQTLLHKLTFTGEPNPINDITYHPNGLMASMLYNNGTEKTQEIANDNLTRPHRIYTSGVTDPVTGNSKNFQSGIFTYDCAGNITAIGPDRYTYDAVNRLTQATVEDLAGQNQSFQYSFDRFGNIKNFNNNALSVDKSTNRLSQSQYVYDDFGNLTQTPSFNYSYDPFNMVTEGTTPEGSTNYIYESTGQGQHLRVMTIDPNGDIEWSLRGVNNKLLRTYKRVSNEPARAAFDYIYAGSLASRLEYLPSGAVKRHYIVSDHLGNIRQRTDAAGKLIRAYKYDPYGNDLPGSNLQEDDAIRFTEHEKDNDQQIYMKARYYNPTLGRFNSIDAILGTGNNPLSWNRYAYVRNNPMAYIDPDGNKENTFMTLLSDSKEAFAATLGTSLVAVWRYDTGKKAAKIAKLEHRLKLTEMKPIPKTAKKKFLWLIPYESSSAKRKINAYKALRRLSHGKLKSAFKTRALAAGVGGVGVAVSVAEIGLNVWKLHSEMVIDGAINNEEGDRLFAAVEIAKAIELEIQKDEKACDCKIERTMETVTEYHNRIFDNGFQVPGPPSE